MSLRYGLVGLPNAGKSTLFNALTSSFTANVAPYPFCTIEPNVGHVPIPDQRLHSISKIIKPEKVISHFVEFVDIAGLVKGASQGEGLGNKFLSHIRETDSFLHIVRCFDKIHSKPLEDIEIIDLELLLSDVETMEKSVNKLEKLLKGKVSLKEEYEIHKNLLAHLESGKPARDFITEESQIQKIGFPSLAKFLKHKALLTAKPALYVCNIDEDSLKNKNFDLVNILKKKFGEEQVLVVCADIESQMSALTKEEKIEFLKDLQVEEPGLHQLLRKAYHQLNLITFFTAGPKEVRAWTLTEGTLAPQAGGIIHSDFEKGFIRAEVYSCEDFFRYKTEKELKNKGLIRSEGKKYKVRDGDIIHFLFN